MDDLICDGRFDARLVRENKSAKGIFITLEIAADDYFAAKLSDVRPGALLKIGYQEIVDVSVQPLEDSRDGGASPSPLVTVPRPQANEAGISKPKKRFEDYPLSAQSAMLCDEPDFWKFLSTVYPARWGQSSAEHTAKRAADTVRTLCSVTSRREFDTPGPRADLWGMVYENFQQWQTDQRHAESIRR